MRRRLIILLLIPIVAISVFLLRYRHSPAENSLAQVKARGTLRVGLDASFPPFELLTPEGTLTGLDVELAQLLAAHLGVKAEFHNISFDGLYDALLAEKADLVVSGLPYDPMRTEDIMFTKPYFDDGLVLVSSHADHLVSPETVTGTVAVEMGSEASTVARQVLVSATTREFLSEPEVIRAVLDARADWGLVTRLSACMARRDDAAIAINYQVTHQPYCIALRKKAQSLGEAVAEALEDIMASDQWRQLQARWLGEGC